MRPRTTLRASTAWRACLCAAAGIIAVDALAGVNTITQFSPVNGRNLSFQVYTPPAYADEPTRRYPTVYSLHGIGGTSLQRANLYGPTLDARITAGDMAPMIWVFPDGQTNSFYGNAFDGHKQVAAHFLDEIIPFVDANFRTRAHRVNRAMEGFSMGGFGALMVTAKRPDLFSTVVEYGGALATWQNLVMIDDNKLAKEMYDTIETNWLPYSLWDLTAANATALRTTVNYKMIVGDADSQYNSNTRFRDYLVGLGIDPQFQVLPGVEHLSGSYLNEGSGLRFLSSHFLAPPAPTGDFDADGDVDGGDFMVWQRQAGLTRDRSADGNYDGMVDAADLAIWRQEFVAGGESVASAANVPEPAATLLLGIALLVPVRDRRRR